MRLRLTIQPPPMTANERRGAHWAKAAREKKRVAKEVAAQWHQAGRPRFGRVRIDAAQIGGRMDPGGVADSLKPVLDALTERYGCGCIKDDSRKYLELGEIRSVPKGRGETTRLVVDVIPLDGPGVVGLDL